MVTDSSIKCPYTKIQLILSTIDIEKKLTPEKQEEIKQALAKYATDPEDKMKAVAEFIGVSIDKLIESPNMDSLIIRYDYYRVNKMLEELEKVGLKNIEAWAILILITHPDFFDSIEEV